MTSGVLGFLYREFFITVDVLKNAVLGLPVPREILAGSKTPNVSKLEKLAMQMMDAVQRADRAKTDKDLQFFSSRSDQLDAQINELVSSMFELDEREAQLVQSGQVL